MNATETQMKRKATAIAKVYAQKGIDAAFDKHAELTKDLTPAEQETVKDMAIKATLYWVETYAIRAYHAARGF